MRPKWAQKRPKQPKMGPNAPKMTPNLGKMVRYVKPPYHHVFGPPTPRWQRSAATLQLKNGQKWAPGGRNGPKRGQQQQATSRWASFDISGTPIARGPKLGPKGPLPKALLPTKFGPPTPGWRRSAATLLLRMAKNGPLEAKMSPKEAKTAQNAPKCPQTDPNPRCKVPLRKATLSPCVWAPTPRWHRSAATLQLKNGQKWAPGGRNAPKRGQQQQATSRWASFDISGKPIA